MVFFTALPLCDLGSFLYIKAMSDTQSSLYGETDYGLWVGSNPQGSSSLVFVLQQTII